MSARIATLLWSALLLGGIVGVVSTEAAVVDLSVDHDVPQAAFAARDIQKALESRGHRVTASASPDGIRIVLCLRSEARQIVRDLSGWRELPQAAKPEGYSIRVTSKPNETTYWVIGVDPAGVMYGGLEVAEIIRVDDLDGIEDVDQSPYMAMRGTKFNCPLDVRTPSYSDVSDAAQHNIAEMWSFDFWKEYIDTLARYRYNYISLWSLHPFPSLLKVPDYPDVALDDVKRSTTQWKERYPLEGSDSTRPRSSTIPKRSRR